MFIDKVTVTVEGGVGGSGAEAFRRESGTPRGGPSGGDGGDGGSVILVCDPQLSTLLDFRYRSEYRAQRGAHGEGSNRTGKAGSDLELRVPPGTVVRDQETDEFLGELLASGERLVVAPGGRGGRGNARFATSTNQAPTRWEPGFEGVRRTIELTLKLIADVGLVGEPNAGKSTFLSAISAARPKVADYPFTTLTPNLGVVDLSGHRSFVVADIPGIIEGAHEGKGLGHQFLRHIERTRTLAIMVPVDDPAPEETYRRIIRELGQYSEELSRRPRCLVLTKRDLLGPNDPVPEIAAPDVWGSFVLSAVSREGLEPLLEALWTRVREAVAAGVGEDEPGRPEASSGERGVAAEGPPGESGQATREDARSNDPSLPGDRSLEREKAWWAAVDEES